MHKKKLWTGALSLLLVACQPSDRKDHNPLVGQRATSQTFLNEPVPLPEKSKDIAVKGAKPRYEEASPGTNQDYTIKGRTYRINDNPQEYSAEGLASRYGNESSGNPTATGETFDPDKLSAAHATLPIPGYVKVTNLENGRQLVVRLNDRGPFVKGRIIDLSQAAAERLGIGGTSQVKVDYIHVAKDGSLSGPGADDMDM